MGWQEPHVQQGEVQSPRLGRKKNLQQCMLDLPNGKHLVDMVLVDPRLKMSQQWALVANKAYNNLGCMKECCHSVSGEVIPLLCLALLNSYMEWQVHFLASQYKRHGHTGGRPKKDLEGEEDEERLLSVMPSDKIKGHILKPRKYHLDIGKCFATRRITNHSHKFPREAV